MKIENETKQVTIIPGATVQEIINLVGAEVIITDKNGNQLDKEAVPGTGCKINGTYSLVMLGDVNGDGETSALDAAMILRFTIGQYQMDNLQKEASILAEESEPTALDAAKILRYTVGQFSINIQ